MPYKRLASYVLFIASFVLIAGVFVQPTAEALERIAVLDFSTIDVAGEVIDPRANTTDDTARLSQVLSLSIVSRLIQYGQSEAYDTAAIEELMG